MKKQVTAILLALCLTLALLPTAAFAASVSWRQEGDTLIYSGTGKIVPNDLAPESVIGQIKHVVVEQGITNLPFQFLYNAKTVETVTLPEGLTVIQADTFRGCDNLRSINIPGTVTTLQDYALHDLKSLENIQLPAGLTSMGQGALNNCDSLKQIVVPGGIADIPESALANCESLEEVMISEGIRSIGDGAFSRDPALKRVSIPNTVTSIGASAFFACTGLEEITLPASLTSLEPRAFLFCDNLKKITFLGTQEQWDAFEPLLSRVGTPLSCRVECLGTGAAVTAKVTFNANSGTVSPAQKAVTYAADYGALPVPVNGNRPFFGWFTQPEGGECITEFNQMMRMEDHTLYAHWGSGSSALTPAAGQMPDPSSKSNAGANNTGTLTGTYLYANEKGGLTRVEAADHAVIVNELDGSFNLQARMTIPFELPFWGGFFAGERYNFLIFGQRNSGKDPEQEVLRVVKYDKNWERIDSASVHGAYTLQPFYYGGLDCAEEGDFLVIHTCHQMYDEHQANMSFIFRQSNMTQTYARTGVSNERTGYVSHSFHQKVLVDSEKRLVTLDLGDAFPCAIALNRYDNEVDFATGGLIETPDLYLVQEYPDVKWCRAGDLAETANSYLVAYRYDPDFRSDLSHPYDIHVQFVDKNTLIGQSVRLTTGGSVGNPMVAPLGLEGGYILWSGYDETEDTLYYARYSANGTLGAVQTAEGLLSDCKPVVYQGKLVWCVTVFNGASRKDELRFYTLDPATGAVTHKDFVMSGAGGGSNPQPTVGKFTDVPAGAFFADAVTWAVSQNIAAGVTDTTFAPAADCATAHILAFLWRGAGRPGATANMTWNDEMAIVTEWTKGWGIAVPELSSVCTRAAAVTYLWKAAGSPEPKSAASFADVPAGADYAKAVAWAVEKGITAGTGPDTFSPGLGCTRGQIVSFLYRAYT